MHRKALLISVTIIIVSRVITARIYFSRYYNHRDTGNYDYGGYGVYGRQRFVDVLANREFHIHRFKPPEHIHHYYMYVTDNKNVKGDVPVGHKGFSNGHFVDAQILTTTAKPPEIKVNDVNDNRNNHDNNKVIPHITFLTNNNHYKQEVIVKVVKNSKNESKKPKKEVVNKTKTRDKVYVYETPKNSDGVDSNVDKGHGADVVSVDGAKIKEFDKKHQPEGKHHSKEHLLYYNELDFSKRPKIVEQHGHGGDVVSVIRAKTKESPSNTIKNDKEHKFVEKHHSKLHNKKQHLIYYKGLDYPKRPKVVEHHDRGGDDDEEHQAKPQQVDSQKQKQGEAPFQEYTVKQSVYTDKDKSGKKRTTSKYFIQKEETQKMPKQPKKEHKIKVNLQKTKTFTVINPVPYSEKGKDNKQKSNDYFDDKQYLEMYANLQDDATVLLNDKYREFNNDIFKDFKDEHDSLDNIYKNSNKPHVSDTHWWPN